MDFFKIGRLRNEAFIHTSIGGFLFGNYYI